MDRYMDDHIKEYYSVSSHGKFQKVIALHDCPDVDWENLCEMAPSLPKGWYELCQLPPEDRIQFTLDFWLTKLSYHLNIDVALSLFFGALDDIGVYLTQKKGAQHFEVEMVYSLICNRGFYRGAPPALDHEIIDLQKLFPDYILPEDYLDFLQIHNGFCKTTDSTGIISSNEMNELYLRFQELIQSRDSLTSGVGEFINPKMLIPFYESFGMPYFQCFWAEWHPECEMGNVYYSSETNSISKEKTLEDMAFPTYLDWLIFYLEQIEI